MNPSRDLRNRARVERKISELKSMHQSLSDLVRRCHGDASPDCPILDDLAGTGS